MLLLAVFASCFLRPTAAEEVFEKQQGHHDAEPSKSQVGKVSVEPSKASRRRLVAESFTAGLDRRRHRLLGHLQTFKIVAAQKLLAVRCVFCAMVEGANPWEGVGANNLEQLIQKSSTILTRRFGTSGFDILFLTFFVCRK
eukprot:GHVT01019092.1.p3 GENE.GHVT01019092.1~~GHVT01019092.1.p3  ORF type:complete len:141 (-),score=20.76 GHVT01019092.1:1959-2381(-)